MKLDYHMHSRFSFDGESATGPILAAAEAQGLDEICFTDHVETFGLHAASLPDLSTRSKEMEELSAIAPSVTIRQGAEVSLLDDASGQKAWAFLSGFPIDFILGSVHMVDGIDVWTDRYYAGRSKQDTYRDYFKAILNRMPTFPQFHVLAHYDFVAKYAPYEDRAVTYGMAGDIFDEIFRYLLEHGKTLEINTASWQQDSPWGLDLLRRYVELGGEFITVGSDAHTAGRVGARIGEAVELARQAGLRYLATYQAGRPLLRRL